MALPHENEWPLPPSIASFASLDARELPVDADQIERDLHRAGRIELGVADADVDDHYAALRRVLRAWCWAAPAQGYSQAMSRIAATLLVSAGNDAEKAFLSFAWLMRSLPGGYYDLGHRIEVRALRLLAAWRWPDVFGPSMYEALELVTTAWFLSLWAGVLPLECCVAVWAQTIVDGADDDDGGGGGAADGGAAADTSLRVAMALLERVLMPLHEAVAMDAADGDAAVAEADEEPSLGCHTYNALQHAATWPAGEAGALVEAALAVELPPSQVAEARRLAASQLEAEAERRTRERRAARERADELARREAARVRRAAEADGGSSTTTRLGEQQLEAFEAEVAERGAREQRAKRHAHAHVRTSLEAQEGDLRMSSGAGGAASLWRAALASCGACGALGRCMVRAVLALPLCVAAAVVGLQYVARRCVGGCATRVQRAARRGAAGRRAPLAAKDLRVAVEAG